MNNPLDYNKINYKHIRPNLNLGDLDGPEGNIYVIMGRLTRELKNLKLFYERDEIETLIYNYTPNYDTGFDKIRFFLNIDPAPKKINLEDLNFEVDDKGDIVFKVSKEEFLKNQQDIVNYNNGYYVDKEFDENGLNYLGRNKFFYIDSVSKLEKEFSKMSIEEISSVMNQVDYCNSTPMMHLIKNENISIFNYMIDNYSELIKINDKDMYERNFLYQIHRFFINVKIESDLTKIVPIYFGLKKLKELNENNFLEAEALMEKNFNKKTLIEQCEHYTESNDGKIKELLKVAMITYEKNKLNNILILKDKNNKNVNKI